MKVRELIEKLIEHNPETPVMILDGFNGSGFPREINYGPISHKVTEKDYHQCADCEDFPLGSPIIVIGYGCY